VEPRPGLKGDHSGAPTAAGQDESKADRTLDSWKEIADFLGVSVRTELAECSDPQARWHSSADPSRLGVLGATPYSRTRALRWAHVDRSS